MERESDPLGRIEMSARTETRKIPACVADCPNPATWLAWFPTHDEHEAPSYGTVLGVCGDHVILAQTEDPGSEVVQITDLPMTCSACGEPVWAKHADGHAVVAATECEWCAWLIWSRAESSIEIRTEPEHARCSCPEMAAYLTVTEGS